jgi:hypothetical protein
MAFFGDYELQILPNADWYSWAQQHTSIKTRFVKGKKLENLITSFSLLFKKRTETNFTKNKCQ